ncbi:MAG: excinuclease ABC subunit UvrC [Patescibacteria group bacterium]|nr:excinuclease ABC subunit UvrC [Patescibacteria group bacterium]
MNTTLAKKIKILPKTSGVYLYRDKNKRIIYVGKAVNLKSRVSSYFQKTLNYLPKTVQLIKEIESLEWIETESEVGALLLESELIKRYQPKFNVEWRDNKNYLFLKIPKEDFPMPGFVRYPSDDKATYFGPYIDATAVRQVLKLLRKSFPFRSKGDLKAKKACLYYHLRQCPGVCIEAISKSDYQKNIRKIIQFFEGKSEKMKKEFEKEMKKAAREKNFEKAAYFRNVIFNLERIDQIHILKKEDFSKTDHALYGLQKELGLKKVPRRIECYDISNIQGKYAVGSMVVFENGLPAKENYRKFKVKKIKGPDDPAMIGEIIKRRFEKDWELPQLIVVDGGKLDPLERKNEFKGLKINIPLIGLAKRFEEIYTVIPTKVEGSLGKFTLSEVEWARDDNPRFKKIILPKNSESLYLLQRIRDEAHRFAITYFRETHKKEARKSGLDDISGIGPKTKKKLLKEFGSIVKIKEASESKIAKIIGEKKAKIIKLSFRAAESWPFPPDSESSSE